MWARILSYRLRPLLRERQVIAGQFRDQAGSVASAASARTRSKSSSVNTPLTPDTAAGGDTLATQSRNEVLVRYCWERGWITKANRFIQIGSASCRERAKIA